MSTFFAVDTQRATTRGIEGDLALPEESLLARALRLEGFESEEEEERFELLESERASHEHSPREEKRARPPPASSCQSA